MTNCKYCISLSASSNSIRASVKHTTIARPTPDPPTFRFAAQQKSQEGVNKFAPHVNQAHNLRAAKYRYAGFAQHAPHVNQARSLRTVKSRYARFARRKREHHSKKKRTSEESAISQNKRPGPKKKSGSASEGLSSECRFMIKV